ncbi:MAG: inorganic phosphate transporter [Isosphaeraceae bacterium]
MISSFLGDSIPIGTLALLAVALGLALGFEFVNGFHDTANAVATVIYTRSLRPQWAVTWSGLCNFLGVYLGGTAVAFSIVHLLPVDLLIGIGTGAGLAMVFALLLAAMTWNVGTWYLGLPASSSHTLIGAILGVGLMHSAMQGNPGAGVNWSKAGEVGLSLLISPLLGFLGAALLLRVFLLIFPIESLYAEPSPDRPPPPWIRGILLVTCTGVSLAHGSNDGQKGVGLVMLILIGLLPSWFVLDARAGADRIERAVAASREIDELLARQTSTARSPAGDIGEIRTLLEEFRGRVEGLESLGSIPLDDRQGVRKDILAAVDGIGWLSRHGHLDLDGREKKQLKAGRQGIEALTDYAPTWVLIAVATALGVGTTVGWKRIVVTVGEKIGKAHLNYAQGACAEMVAMGMIGVADYGGYPVSTTQVLSSGIAGTMAAQGSGVQLAMVKKILLTWVLTLPASSILSALIYGALRLFVTG